MTQGYKAVSVHIRASKHMHKVTALNASMELRLNKHIISVYGHQTPKLTRPVTLSIAVSQGKARATLLQNVHKVHKRARPSCRLVSVGHPQAPSQHLCGKGRSVQQAMGSQGEGKKQCKMHLNTHLAGAVYTWN